MTSRKIYQLLAEGEGKCIEFKEKVEKIGKDLVAFLNSEGGTIIVGVSDDGKIVGVGEKDMTHLEHVLSAIEPPPKVKWHTEKVGGKKLLVIEVEKSPYLHFYAGRSYVRVGSSSVPLRWEEMAKRLAETLYLSFDTMVNPDARLEDIDKNLVQRYLEERAKRRGVGKPKISFEKVLKMIGILKKSGITNGGLLFFSSHPQAFFPHAAVRLTIHKTAGTYSKLIEGSLWEQWKAAVEEVKKHIPIVTYLAGIEREEMPAVHPFVYREAVANALVHRNYLDSRFIEITIYEDKIVIKNPGGFPPEISPTEPEHKPRNPLLARYFYDVGIIDKYGSGIHRMFAVCKELGYPEPKFVKWQDETVVEIPFIIPVMKLASTETERKVLSALTRGAMSTGEIARLIGVSSDTVLRVINKFLKMGVVEGIGKGRGRKYKIKQWMR